jgi:phosphatidylglycerophosphatase A
MEKQNSYKKFIILSLSTVFGIGFLPVMPGTFGSLAAIGLFYMIGQRSIFFIIIILFFSISLPVCVKASDIFKEKDPKQVVIDEFIGQSLVLLVIPKELIFVLLSFILFRGFDIFKIYPANVIEIKAGPKGIIWDDLIAAGYSILFILSLRLILYIS